MSITAESGLSVKFDTLPKLTGQSNYKIWAAMWRDGLEAAGWWGLVNGEIPCPDKTKEEKATQTASSSSALTQDELLETDIRTWDRVNAKARFAIKSSVEQGVLPTVAYLIRAHEMWTALKKKFDYETPSSTINILRDVNELRCKDEANLSNHLTEFENKCALFADRCTPLSTDDLCKQLSHTAHCDKVKASYLLSSLPRSMENVVDNLQSKPDCRYDDVHNHLLSIASCRNEENGDKAYSTSKDTKKKEKGKKRQAKDTDEPVVCTWCKKTGENTFEGYSYQQCRKLKAFKENKKQPKEEKKE